MQNYVNYTGDWDGVEVAADGTATGRSELRIHVQPRKEREHLHQKGDWKGTVMNWG